MIDSSALAEFLYYLLYEPVIYTTALMAAFVLIAALVAIVVNTIPFD